MPRTRELKPAFFQDEDLATLGRDHRLLFSALWTLADREGRLEDRPQFIKIHFCPYDADVTAAVVSGLIDGLVGIGVLLRYQVDGKGYLLVKNFKKHQHIHPKEAPSLFPEPDTFPSPVRELPGITGNVRSCPVIQPLPSLPSLPSESSLPSRGGPPARDPGTTEHAPPQPSEPIRPRDAHTLQHCLGVAVRREQPQAGLWAPGRFAAKDAQQFLAAIEDIEPALPELERKIALFAKDPDMQPWTVAKFVDRYNSIGLPKLEFGRAAKAQRGGIY